MLSQKSYTPAQLQAYITMTFRMKCRGILDKKRLRNLFETQHNIQFADDIGTHIQWAFNNIYKVHYPNANTESPIARYHHGIQHVTRAAMYVPVFANLYRRYGDEEAQALTDDDIKLLQIAAVFHDAARENEGEDLWDHESAILLYLYLTNVLEVEPNKAKQIAEAVANKDPQKDGYFTINVLPENQFTWEWKLKIPEKNIYQKIIHDADCLDIIRARDVFDASYLDFYQQYNTNKFAFEEMAHLIIEARSLIEIQGDSRNRTKTDIKLDYENENAYLASSSSVDPKKHPIMTALHKKLLPIDELKTIELVDLTPYDPKLGLTEENLQRAMNEGKIFGRGIPTVSAHDNKINIYKSRARIEIEKTMRRPGIKTTSSKADADKKDGNDFRSVFMVGCGSGPFTNAGFMILDPNLDSICKISAVDFRSGCGKKSHFKELKTTITNEEKEQQLRDLHRQLKLGGSANASGGNNSYAANHVEILYHVKDYSAIYFSNDPNLYNKDAYNSPEPSHTYSPILEAIFLRNEYQKSSLSKQELPIFEYSGIHNTIRLVSAQELTRENIKKMWVAMCSQYIQECLDDVDSDHAIYQTSVDDIKILSMYKTPSTKYDKSNAPADSNYDEDFQKEITEAIELERQRLIKKQEMIVLNKIKENKLSILSDEAFFKFIRNPGLIPSVQGSIAKELPDIDECDVSSIEDMFIGSEFTNNVFQNFSPLLPKKNILLAPDTPNLERYYTNKTLRRYALAKAINAVEVCSRIQAEMKNIAINELRYLSEKNKLGNDIHLYNSAKLREIITFSVAFDFYPEVKDETDQLINEYFNLTLNHLQENMASLTKADLKNYCDSMSHFESIKTLTQSQCDKIKEIMLRILKTKPEAIRGDTIDSFQKLAQQIHLPVSMENIALTIINNQDHTITRDSAIELISSLRKFISLENVALFEPISRKIATNSDPIKRKVNFKEWFAVVGKIEFLSAHNKKFNQDQLNILQERVNEFFEQISFDLKDLNPQAAFVILISQINSFLTEKQKLKLIIPDFIILELNKRLSDPKIYALFLETLTKLPADNKKLSLSDIRTLFPEICEQLSASSKEFNERLSDPKIYALFLEVLIKLLTDHKELSISDIRTLLPEICEQFSASSKEFNERLSDPKTYDLFLEILKKLLADNKELSGSDIPTLFFEICEQLSASSKEFNKKLSDPKIYTFFLEILTKLADNKKLSVSCDIRTLLPEICEQFSASAKELNKRLSDPKIDDLFLEILTKLLADNKKLSVSDTPTLLSEIRKQFVASSKNENNEIYDLLSCLTNLKSIDMYLSEDQKKSSPQLTTLLNQMKQYEQITESLNPSSQENQWQILEKWVAMLPKEDLAAINRSDLHHPHLERCIKLEIEKSKFEKLWHDENTFQENIIAFLTPISAVTEKVTYGQFNTYEETYAVKILNKCSESTIDTADLYAFLTQQLKTIDENATKSATFWSNQTSAAGETAMRILFIRHKVAEIMNNPLKQQMLDTKNERNATLHC